MKSYVGLPIHLHTHEGSGNAIYTYARAIDAGVDIVDTAMSSMSCGTSQPSTSSLYYALSGHPRQPRLDVDSLNELSRYWETVRPIIKQLTEPKTSLIQKFMFTKCRAANIPI